MSLAVFETSLIGLPCRKEIYYMIFDNHEI
jgi:hypothetical protein